MFALFCFYLLLKRLMKDTGYSKEGGATAALRRTVGDMAEAKKKIPLGKA